MDRAGAEDERETLKGIVSILLSLAVLAEFLCLLPLWVRIPVLALLRPAEAVARQFAFEWAGGGLALPPAAIPGPDGDGRAEAMRLARCFRVLAAIFSGLQAAGRRLFRCGPDGRLVHLVPAMAWPGHLPGRVALHSPPGRRASTHRERRTAGAVLTC
jgi:hypothetical protein